MKVSQDPNVVAFLNELSKPDYNPIRDRRKEGRLIRRYRNEGDRGAFQILVNSHLRYVVATALKYLDYDDHDIDTFNAGIVGLIVAINKYDLDSKYKLITYARNWIRHEIEKYKRHKTVIELSHHITYTLRRVDIAIDDLRKIGAEYSDEEVSGATGLSKKRIRAACRARKARQCVVMDRVADREEGKSVGWNLEQPDLQLDPSNIATLVEISDCIGSAIRSLMPKEAEVIRRRYFDPDKKDISYRSIASDIGCSHEQVRKLEKTALIKLRMALPYSLN